MATRLYSVPKNKTAKDVVEAVGSATTTAAIEVTIDLAVVTKKADALRGIEQIYNRIKSGKNWPPA